MPPPMAFQEVTVGSNIIDVAILTNKTGPAETTVVVLDHKNLLIFKWSLGSKPPETLDLVTSARLSTLIANRQDTAAAVLPQQISLMSHDCLSVLTSSAGGSQIHIVQLHSERVDSTRSFDVLPAQALLVSPLTQTFGLYLHSVDGQVVEHTSLGSFSSAASTLSTATVATFPSKVRYVAITDIEEGAAQNSNQMLNGDSRHSVAFGLTLSGSLFANNRCLAKDCTSFVITPAHLIFTTTQHLLKFVHIAEIESKCSIRVWIWFHAHPSTRFRSASRFSRSRREVQNH